MSSNRFNAPPLSQPESSCVMQDAGLGAWQIEGPKPGALACSGDASKLFRQDALHILRGCRLASQTGLTLDPATLAVMKSHKMLLARAGIAGVVAELDGLLLGDHVYDALMQTVDVLVAVMPEIAACRGFEQRTPYHIYDVWEHTAWVVQRCPATRLARWAALLHDIGKPGAHFMDGDVAHFYGHPLLSVNLARGLLQRLEFEQEFVKRVLTLVRIHDRTIAATPESVRAALAELDGDVELFRTLCALKRADALSQSHLAAPRLQLALDLANVLDDLLDT